MSKLYKDTEGNFYGYHKDGTQPATQAEYDQAMAKKVEEAKKTDEYAIAEAKKYLAETDYMVIRAIDSGRAVDALVKSKREECRQTLHRLVK